MANRPTKKVKAIEQSMETVNAIVANMEIEVEINGKKWSGIVDTGCNPTLISDRVISKNERLEESNITLGCANSSKLEVIGRTTKEITIKGQTYQTEAEVTRGLNSDVILGIEFLLEYAA